MNGGQYHSERQFPANIPLTPSQPDPQQGSPANLWRNSTPQTADIQASPMIQPKPPLQQLGQQDIKYPPGS